MDILEDVKRRLNKDRRSLQAISRESGIPFSTLRHIKTGATVSPRYITLIKLRSFLVDKKVAA